MVTSQAMHYSCMVIATAGIGYVMARVVAGMSHRWMHVMASYTWHRPIIIDYVLWIRSLPAWVIIDYVLFLPISVIGHH